LKLLVKAIRQCKARSTKFMTGGKNIYFTVIAGMRIATTILSKETVE